MMSTAQPYPSLLAIQAALSAPRFQPYLEAAGQNPQLALELYQWNLKLSAAFWEVIAAVEVVTRNAMHDQLTNAYGALWYDDTTILDNRSLGVIREAKVRASRGLPRSSPLSPGKVVSEMNFGAWVSLLDQGGYSTTEGRQLRYHDTLWVPALQYAFPGGLAHRKRTNRGLRIVQGLRNRIGHHEKIFIEPFKDTGLTLQELHTHCLEIIGWASSDAKAWAGTSSRVVAVLAERPAGT